MLDNVTTIAEQLVADLQQAESACGNWTDARQADALVHAALDRCLGQLSATDLWGEANRLPSGPLWQIAGDWLTVGELQHRARFKPRGYAGDFEMLEKICTDYTCDHPLGKVFDRYFQAQHAPQAVRNRTEIVADAIVQTCQQKLPSGIARVASIGSGPALDVRWALDRLDVGQCEAPEVTLIDMDPAALDHAEKHLTGRITDERLHLVRENLFRLGQPGRAEQFLQGCDLIACTGLFDYLDDQNVAGLLGTLWQMLAENGRLLVFNFAPTNRSRAYMEWIGNWYLIYRDTDQMQKLAGDAGIPVDQMRIDAEPSGANLYWDATKL